MTKPLAVALVTVTFMTTAIIVPTPAGSATPFVTSNEIELFGFTWACAAPMPLRVSSTRVGTTEAKVPPDVVTVAVLVTVCEASVRPHAAPWRRGRFRLATG